MHIGFVLKTTFNLDTWTNSGLIVFPPYLSAHTAQTYFNPGSKLKLTRDESSALQNVILLQLLPFYLLLKAKGCRERLTTLWCLKWVSYPSERLHSVHRVPHLQRSLCCCAPGSDLAGARDCLQCELEVRPCSAPGSRRLCFTVIGEQL